MALWVETPASQSWLRTLIPGSHRLMNIVFWPAHQDLGVPLASNSNKFISNVLIKPNVFQIYKPSTPIIQFKTWLILTEGLCVCNCCCNFEITFLYLCSNGFIFCWDREVEGFVLQIYLFLAVHILRNSVSCVWIKEFNDIDFCDTGFFFNASPSSFYFGYRIRTLF